MSKKHLHTGQILIGPLFSEPMRVETVCANGPDTWMTGLFGAHSERFRRVTLTSRDLDELTILDARHRYDGDGRLLRLAPDRGQGPGRCEWHNSFPWHEVTKVAHYWLELDTITKPMEAEE